MQLYNSRSRIKNIVFSVIIGLLLSASAVLGILYYNAVHIDETDLRSEISDEALRAKFFVEDWYDDLSSQFTTLTVKKNELSFESGLYTCTFAKGRIRAVYNKASDKERYFKFEYITYLEFSENNGDLQCQLFVNESGENKFIIS